MVNTWVASHHLDGYQTGCMLVSTCDKFTSMLNVVFAMDTRSHLPLCFNSLDQSYFPEKTIEEGLIIFLRMTSKEIILSPFSE